VGIFLDKEGAWGGKEDANETRKIDFVHLKKHSNCHRVLCVRSPISLPRLLPPTLPSAPAIIAIFAQKLLTIPNKANLTNL